MSVRPHNLLRVGATALFAAMSAVGCSGAVASTSDASTTSTQALLSVERTASAADPTGSARTHASAYFLRMQAGADQGMAARLVGASVVLPPMGQCAAVEVLGDQGMPLASLGPVDLVDVGEVALEASEARATLAARAFPDVVDLVSGVVYTTRDLVANPLPLQGAYTFRISGSQVVPPMELVGRAPGPIDDFAVGGVPLHADAIALPRDNVSITWRPQPGADLVYVELASAEDGPLERVRCTFANSGVGQIAQAALPKAASQTITVHVVHREPVAAAGIDSGEIRFDLATNGAVRFDAARP
jgi:hypothetical protein